MESQPQVVVVDYRKGNLKSVERGLAAAGAAVEVTSDAEAIARAGAVVLPGVGAFADAAATMAELGQVDAVRLRSEERRVGKECSSLCRYRWSPYH